MFTFVVIGMTGEGKSEFSKKYIGKTRNALVNDVQDEYGPRTKYPGQAPLNLSSNTKDKRARYIGGKWKEYLDIIKTKRNTVVIFEEATMFLQGRVSDETYSILINKMFTKNVYILNFHSIRKVPPGILDIANYVVLYRTMDEDILVEKKYPSLYNDFLECKKTLQKGEYKVIKRIV
jgi:hypothetical protein